MAISIPNLVKVTQNSGWVMAAGRHLGFCYRSKMALRHVADCPCPPSCQIWWQYLKWRPSYCDFPFSKWRPAAILDFVVARKWHPLTLRAVHGHQRTKFGEDIWNVGWVMAIFLFPKWRPVAILDFITGQKWRYSTLRTVHVYHGAKFGDNTSNGGGVIAIFRFSKPTCGTTDDGALRS